MTELFWRISQAASDELPLTFKGCFQFLYSFHKLRNESIVFSIWHSYQITWSIIRFDSVKVMNNPAFRQCLAMSLFPDKNVFRNITSLVRSLVFGGIYIHIIVLYTDTTFPHGVVSSSKNFAFIHSAYYPSIFTGTSMASFSLPRNENSTIKAGMSSSFFIKPSVVPMSASIISLIGIQTFLVIQSVLPFVYFRCFFILSHILIIALFWSFINGSLLARVTRG